MRKGLAFITILCLLTAPSMAEGSKWLWNIDISDAESAAVANSIEEHTGFKLIYDQAKRTYQTKENENYSILGRQIKSICLSENQSQKASQISIHFRTFVTQYSFDDPYSPTAYDAINNDMLTLFDSFEEQFGSGQYYYFDKYNGFLDSPTTLDLIEENIDYLGKSQYYNGACRISAKFNTLSVSVEYRCEHIGDKQRLLASEITILESASEQIDLHNDAVFDFSVPSGRMPKDVGL